MQIINSEGKPHWQVKEEYRKINRSKEDILILGDGMETAEVCFMYPDFSTLKYDGKDCLLYSKVKDNHDTFKIGSLELPYVREDVNSAWRNCRAVEVALGGWFGNKFNNDIVEVGDVCWQYSVFKDWKVIDPCGPYEKSIRKDVLDYDYTGLNFLSLSTFEHISSPDYNNTDSEKGIKALQKVYNESKNYLITIPIGDDRKLENFIKNQDKIRYTFMVRDNKRGETNNWHQSDDKSLFHENYLHFDFNLDYYGCAYVICVLSNLPEILCKKN